MASARAARTCVRPARAVLCQACMRPVHAACAGICFRPVSGSSGGRVSRPCLARVARVSPVSRPLRLRRHTRAAGVAASRGGAGTVRPGPGGARAGAGACGGAGVYGVVPEPELRVQPGGLPRAVTGRHGGPPHPLLPGEPRHALPNPAAARAQARSHLTARSSGPGQARLISCCVPVRAAAHGRPRRSQCTGRAGHAGTRACEMRPTGGPRACETRAPSSRTTPPPHLPAQPRDVPQRVRFSLVRPCHAPLIHPAYPSRAPAPRPAGRVVYAVHPTRIPPAPPLPLSFSRRRASRAPALGI